MANNACRKLPVGIQSFNVIREEGYLYVDKTDIIWNLANNGRQYNFLIRPRRFGKSVLVDTLQAYFEGRKELFEGLKIMELEKEWKQYPVIRFDMSRGGATTNEVKAYLDRTFDVYEQLYGIHIKPTDSLGNRFDLIIKTAYEQTGLKVAILIDEYDSPLQHSWKTPEHEGCTEVYRSVFSILKADDAYQRFVFITGITKFTQISLFSVLNNLTNISFLPEYAAICGITEEEIGENFKPELERMAEVNEWTLQQTHDNLKDYYDGYHFSRRNMVDIYNPFSLLNALDAQDLSCFWVSSGATSMLPKFVDNMELRLRNFENCPILRKTLESSDVINGGAELFLYQTGYLTIKSSDEFGYFLGFPRSETGSLRGCAAKPDHEIRKRYYQSARQSVPPIGYRANRRCHENVESIGCRCALQQQETCLDGYGRALPSHHQYYSECHRSESGGRAYACNRKDRPHCPNFTLHLRDRTETEK